MRTELICLLFIVEVSSSGNYNSRRSQTRRTSSHNSLTPPGPNLNTAQAESSESINYSPRTMQQQQHIQHDYGFEQVSGEIPQYSHVIQVSYY